MVLRGVGAAVALPWLDAMVPACARVDAAARPARLAALYIGNGMNMAAWTPATDGRLVLSPTLAPLAGFERDLVVFSGLDNQRGGSSDPGGLHSRIQPAWLTGTQAKRTEGADVQAGVSMDQVAAAAVGRETSLSSLELALESVETSKACEPAFACTYVSTLSWRDATTPLPMEADPRAVFERLFGDGDANGITQAERQRDRSILDRLTSDLSALQRRLGPGDRRTVDGYVEAIRDVERHLAAAEARQRREPIDVNVGGFTGLPISYAEHVQLMFELMVLGFQADVTRVATVLMVRERSDRLFPESGVLEPSHALSHHEHDPDKLAQQARVNRYHVAQLEGLLRRLRATPDGDATLLDHTLVLFGAGMSDSNGHVPLAVPTLVAGGRGLGMETGRHVRCPSGTPLANLHLALLNRLGVAESRLGNSTGMLTWA